MAKIFISYNRQSESIVRSLANDIEMLGHTVWFDHELSGGQVWWEQILTTVRDCSIFIFVLSPEGLNSTACKREYGYAAELGKSVLPVLVSDGVSINLLPPALSKIEFVDYRKQDRDAAFRLARALSNVPPPGPLPDPLPEPPDVPVSYLGGLTEQVDTNSTLDYQEQTALLVDLKRSLRDPENSEDARTLLKKLRKRRDLFATIAEDIDELLSSGQKPTLKNVSADPSPVHVVTRKLDEVQTSDYPRSKSDQPIKGLDDRIPEKSAQESDATELTGKQRLNGAVIGAAVGIAGYFVLMALSGGVGGVMMMIAYVLGGAIAGAISGVNRTRLIGTALGMLVAVFFGVIGGFLGLLLAILAPPVGAIVGNHIARR